MARILVVDDHGLHTMFKNRFAIIRDEGHTIEHAINAATALGKLQQKRYDLAIVDLSEDVKVRGMNTLSEIIQSDYPSIVLASWSLQYSSYNRVNPNFQYHFDKAEMYLHERILEVIEKEGL